VPIYTVTPSKISQLATVDIKSQDYVFGTMACAP